MSDDLKHIGSKRLVAMTKNEYEDIHFKVNKLIEAVVDMGAIMEETKEDLDMRLERMESVLESIVAEEGREVVWEEDLDDDD